MTVTTYEARGRINDALGAEGKTLPEHLLNELADELAGDTQVSSREFFRRLDHYLGRAEEEVQAATAEPKVRALLPRRDLLDTADGDACSEGSAFTFVELGRNQKGFYLGTDTDSWNRYLYFEPEIDVQGYYCFDNAALAQVPGAEAIAAALIQWHDVGDPASVRHLLDVWDADLATRLFLEERDA